jgi:hypothetical protein
VRLAKVVKVTNTGIGALLDNLLLSPNLMRLLKLFFGLMFLTHAFTCLWFWAAKAYDFENNTWVYNKGIVGMPPGY